MDTFVMPTGATPAVAPVGVRTVNTAAGSHDGILSSQWYSRPDDQRFLDLDTLLASLVARKDASMVKTVETRKMRVFGKRDDDQFIGLRLDDGTEVSPTHYSFGQLCTQVKAPAGFLRQLPAPLAGTVLQHRLSHHETELMKVYAIDQGEQTPLELRALTGPNYGRIFDADGVKYVKDYTDGGDWKVPGTMNWGSGIYDPNTAVTKRSTTLYASDHDCFVFLCRDTHPIEVGKLADGSPDYLFPGFIFCNSETGAGAAWIQTMWLRAVCQNRNLWGVEGSQRVYIRHTSGAPTRFADEAAPALLSFTEQAAGPVVAKVKAAQQISIGAERDDRIGFFTDLGFSKTATEAMFDTFFQEEQRPVRNLWDATQAMTAAARDVPHQDERIGLERAAGKLMEKVTA